MTDYNGKPIHIDIRSYRVPRRHLVKRWVAQPAILTFFWDRTTNDKMADRQLEYDDELVEWCWQHNCTIDQTWIQCPDHATFTAFALRWM